MKKTTTIQLTGILIAAFVIIWIPSCNSKKGNKPDAVTLVNTGCNCETDWFPHNQTPAPPEGIGSPFDTSSTTNCIFHQWSWQKFLWLTKPLPSGNPLFRDSMILVDNQMTPVPSLSGVQLVLEDIGQAGSGGVLQSNPAFNSSNQSDTVYYSIFINSTLQRAADSLKNLIVANPKALANNNFTFPVGSLELKAAWIDVNALAAGTENSYYISDAILKPSGKKTKVALLGIHVVGVVINHPEFIWATFEHKNLAPVYNWKNTTTQDLPVVSADQKLFFKQGDTATWQNLEYPASSNNVFTIYPFGIPRIANDSFMLTSQSEPINFDNIQGLNACADAGLTDVWKNYFYNGSLWINTDGLTPQQQADTINGEANNLGNAAPGSIARGSLAAFNITMETFAQDFSGIPVHQMGTGDLTNCFSCHGAPANITINGTSYGASSPLYLSHIFRSYLSISTGLSVQETEKVRIKDFVEMLKRKKANK